MIADPDTVDNGVDDIDLDLDDDVGGYVVQAKGEENLEKRLEEAKSMMRHMKFIQEEEVDMFIATYEDIAGKSVKDWGNLLHTTVEIVKHHTIEPQNFELLVQRLVEKYPQLLVHTNKDGYTPIYLAIREKKHQLVDYMLSVCVQNKDREPQSLDAMRYLDEALRKPAQEGRTCLHTAFYESINSNTIKTLIENASDKALAVQDGAGKTPMHYAVSFKQCRDARVKLVDLLIKRDLRAMQSNERPESTFLDMPDFKGVSIYQEHQNTRAAVTTRYDLRLQNQARYTDNTTEQAGTSTANKNVVSRDLGVVEDRVIGREALTDTSRNDRAGRNDEPDEKVDEREKEREKERRERKAEEMRQLEEKRKLEESRRFTEIAEREGRGGRFKDTEGVGREPSRSTRYKDAERDVNITQLMTKTDATKQLEPLPNTPLKRVNSSRPDGKAAQEKLPKNPPYDPTLKHVSEQEKVAMNAFKKNSDEMLLKLKLHYLRTRNSEMAISFLYGANMDDIQISFDYDRLPRKIEWKRFTDHFGPDDKSRIQFDRVLQYVMFPRVEVKLTGRLADIERNNEKNQSGPLGRKDMVKFFEWLYKKGVRHIIRVSVDDSGKSDDKVHSDQAIQKSLERFVIEHLDWQKTDLDPETILHVSSKALEKKLTTGDNSKDVELLPDRRLRELSLRWSGSNTALRAWSESEGLPMLPQLQTIYLFKPPLNKMLDSPAWINKKVGEFQTRLNKNRGETRTQTLSPEEREIPTKSTTAHDEINVILRDADTETYGGYGTTFSDAAESATSNSVKGINAHRWLDSTSRFATAMKPFWEETVREFRAWRRSQTSVEESVVIALIDDGVDRFDMDHPSQILEGKSFDFHDGKLRPPYSSARGHGTVMAQMILSVCPMAKIYPIRLRTFDTAEGKSQIDRDYAARAIEAALAKKADIISMSWTLPMVSAKEISINRLKSALERAVNEKVLMFCSSPDEGKFAHLDYPSGPWPDSFFRIGAARADGTVFNWTNEAGTAFVLPGVDVVKDQMKNDRVAEVKYETGSSIATALAAGLAAMIIYCVKASILAVKTANQNKGPVVGIAISDDAFRKIVKHDAMKQAFFNLGPMTKNGFIQVWEGLDSVTTLLEKPRSQLTPEDRQQLTDEFVKFGLKLMSGNQSNKTKVGHL